MALLTYCVRSFHEGGQAVLRDADSSAIKSAPAKFDPRGFMLPTDDPHRHVLRQIHAIREVPLILDVCAKATGMGFTAIAHVTEDRWITCASLDHLNFGLLPGDELEVSSNRKCQISAERRKTIGPSRSAKWTDGSPR
jgi:hypothetical protein